MVGARHLELARRFDIELLDDAIVDDHPGEFKVSSADYMLEQL